MSKQNLCVLLDCTGSMGNAIQTLNKLLPQFMYTSALAKVFDQVGVMVYRDYDTDSRNLTEWSGWKNFEDKGIFQFCRSLIPLGGGGCPEAFKTGLLEVITRTEPKSTIHLLHITDAPYHDSSSALDTEGRQEKLNLKELFIESNFLVHIQTELAKKDATMFYTSIFPAGTPGRIALYRDLCTLFDGNTGNFSNLETEMFSVLNGWLGEPNGKKTRSELVERLGKALKSLTDEKNADYIYTILQDCFSHDVSSLCRNASVGKIWREFCKRRGDQRRGELLKLLEKGKSSLSDKERKEFEEFNRNTYSSIQEITEDLQEWVDKNGVKGVIRYVPDSFLHPQDILKYALECTREQRQQIREFASRLVVDEKETSLKENTIPLNMPPHMIFSYLLHLCAPGTKTAGRPLTILALLCKGTVLDEQARKLLSDRKGKWLDFSYFTEEGPMKGTPKFPENYNSNFLYFLNTHKEDLTSSELERLESIIRVLPLLRLYNVELTGTYREFKSLSGFNYEYSRKCRVCHTQQPLSIVNADDVCGYCASPGESFPINWEKKSDTEVIAYRVQCTKCYGVYARDSKAIVSGESLCYMCRQGEVGKSPRVECKRCGISHITYHGLPNSLCAPCKNNTPVKQRYFTRDVEAAVIFDTEYFLSLYREKGVKSSEILSCGLLKALEKIELCTPVPFQYTPPPFARITNLADLDRIMRSYAGGTPIELSECALCFTRLKQDSVTRACGRKNCDQKICNECGVRWYGVLKPGTLVLERHLDCPFCSRRPDTRIVKRWNPSMMWLRNCKLEQGYYHGWCTRCNKVREVAARACAVAEPNISNWVCEDCRRPPAKDVLCKECPSCTVMTERIAGCNHITCPCGTHWCFECREGFDQADQTYTHMRAEHGRIYADDEPNFEEY